MDDSQRHHAPPQQLVTYTFPPEANYEGMLVGALQRIESGGAIRILEAVFVAREARAGELVAVSLCSDSSAGMIGRLIGFRLDASTRAKETERALEGDAAERIRALADSLQPGYAVAAVLVEHTWVGVLDDAVARIGGVPLRSELLETAAAAEAWARLPGELARDLAHR